VTCQELLAHPLAAAEDRLRLFRLGISRFTLPTAQASKRAPCTRTGRAVSEERLFGWIDEIDAGDQPEQRPGQHRGRGGSPAGSADRRAKGHQPRAGQRAEAAEQGRQQRIEDCGHR